MHVETRVFGEPLLHDGMLMGSVVVGNQMQRFVLGRFTVNHFQESQPLGVGVTRLTLADDLAIQDI